MVGPESQAGGIIEGRESVAPGVRGRLQGWPSYRLMVGPQDNGLLPGPCSPAHQHHSNTPGAFLAPIRVEETRFPEGRGESSVCERLVEVRVCLSLRPGERGPGVFQTFACVNPRAVEYKSLRW